MLEINRKDMKIALIHDREGNLKVHLKSDKYDVTGAEVSIGRKVEDSFQPLISATAKEEGIANLGHMSTIKQHKAQGPLALSIDSVTKKRDQD